MRRVEQIAVGAIVQIKRVALAQFNARDGRARFSDQRAAGLGPELCVLGDEHFFEAGGDLVHIRLQRRGVHARIDRREAAADIDDVDNHAGRNDRAVHAIIAVW